MKRIAVVSTSYPFDEEQAGGHFVRREVEQLVASGNHVTVIAPYTRALVQPGHPTLVWLAGHSAFGPPGVLPRLIDAPWRVVPLSRFMVQARQQLRAAAFDEVIGHWLLPVAGPLLRGLACATEIVVHGSDLRLFLQSPPALRQTSTTLLRRLARQLAERGTVVRFVSHALRNDFLQAVGNHSDPRNTTHRGTEGLTTVARWPLPVCTVAPSPIEIPVLERQRERAKLGISEGEFVALVVGRLIPKKRIETALRYSATLAPRVRCVVIGEGPLRTSLERRFPEAQFLGELPRSSTLSWICAASALIAASTNEGAPTVIREARSLGTPVWTAEVGDVSRWATRDPGIIVDQRLAE